MEITWEFHHGRLVWVEYITKGEHRAIRCFKNEDEFNQFFGLDFLN